MQNSHAQKGTINITAGAFLSIPVQGNIVPKYKTGPGIEAGAQYQFGEQGSILAQLGFASYRIEGGAYEENSTITSLKAGYRYSFYSEGLFLQALAGSDIESGGNYISFTLGAGYRFAPTERYFIDTGIDYINGDTPTRINFKVAVSLFRWGK